MTRSVIYHAEPGFTIMEVLLAVFLSALIMIGLYGIFSSTFSVQKNSYKKDVVQSGAVIGVKSMLRDLETSGSVLYPVAGTEGLDRLVGCRNYDIKLASSGNGVIDPTQQVSVGNVWRNYMYCFTNSTYIDYYYADFPTGTPGACAAGSLCCTDPGGILGGCASFSLSSPPNTWGTAWSAIRLASGVSTISGGLPLPGACDPSCPNCNSRLFCHMTNDVISLHFVVGGSTPPFTVNTSVSLLSSLQAP